MICRVPLQLSQLSPAQSDQSYSTYPLVCLPLNPPVLSHHLQQEQPVSAPPPAATRSPSTSRKATTCCLLQMCPSNRLRWKFQRLHGCSLKHMLVEPHSQVHPKSEKLPVKTFKITTFIYHRCFLRGNVSFSLCLVVEWKISNSYYFS